MKHKTLIKLVCVLKIKVSEFNSCDSVNLKIIKQKLWMKPLTTRDQADHLRFVLVFLEFLK